MPRCTVLNFGYVSGRLIFFASWKAQKTCFKFFASLNSSKNMVVAIMVCLLDDFARAMAKIQNQCYYIARVQIKITWTVRLKKYATARKLLSFFLSMYCPRELRFCDAVTRKCGEIPLIMNTTTLGYLSFNDLTFFSRTFKEGKVVISRRRHLVNF